MLRRLPVIGPWVVGLLERWVGHLLLERVREGIVVTAGYAALVLVVGAAGALYGFSATTSWVVDGVVVCYLAHSLSSAIDAVQQVRSFHRSGVRRLLGVSMTGVVLSVAVPLAGLVTLWAVVAACRAWLAYDLGGGLFGWCAAQVGSWLGVA